LVTAISVVQRMNQARKATTRATAKQTVATIKPTGPVKAATAPITLRKIGGRYRIQWTLP